MLHINWLEALWLLSSSVASYFTYSNLSEARSDKTSLLPSDRDLHVLANGAIRRDILRLVKLAIMLLIGITAAIRPDSGSINVVGGLLFLTLPILLAIDSAGEAIDRRRLLTGEVKKVLVELETRNQREDREMGDRRRQMEAEHRGEDEDAGSRSGS